ncbi:MAG: hypothetical protein DRJ42_16410 [Deltaproteobacteria bacterium]|nr:MAG: hypothetical protein DRJ42_16410 [Deltaproteobacteria bacterium]
MAGRPGDPRVRARDRTHGGSVFETWWFWTIVGVVVVGTAIGIGVAASGGVEGPVNGDTMPAVLTF